MFYNKEQKICLPAFSADKIKKDGKERWTSLLQSYFFPSYMQSLDYEYSKENKGRKVSTFIFQQESRDIAGVHYSIKRSPLNILSTADIISGIVFRESPSLELLSYIVNHFIEFAQKNRVSFIRINPWLPKSIAGEQTDFEMLFNKVLLKKGFHVLEEGRHTYWIDLAKSEEELLNNMKRQTRYEVRQGLKSEIQTCTYEEQDVGLVDQFWKQYKILVEKKGFGGYTVQQFKHEVSTLLSAGLANLYVFKYRNQIINYSIASNFGVAAYLHGAIDYRFKDLEGCPSPGQLAQWKMITNAKAQGAKIYDMGFCPGPVPLKEHPAYKIWRFKYGFGGDHVEYLPVYGKAIKPVSGKIFQYWRYRTI